MKALHPHSHLFAVFTLTVSMLALGTHALHAAATVNTASHGIDYNAVNDGKLIVPGDLSVGAGLDVTNYIDFGTTGTAIPAVRLYYTDSSKTAAFDITAANGIFTWQDNSTARNKMQLNGTNILSLYNSLGTTANISLNGSTGVISASSISTSGNLTANSLTLGDLPGFRNSLLHGSTSQGNSITMTDGQAGGNYSTSMSGGGAGGDYSTAMSAGSAGGDYSTAMSGSGAFCFCSTAMSGGSANGDYSTAMSSGITYGFLSTAMSGGNANYTYSTAMSVGNANGDCSTAMSGGNSNGRYSMAAGFETNAPSYSCTALGSNNTSWGSVDSWRELDPILLVGNGIGWDITTASNALTILKDGQTTLTNKAWRASVASDLSNSNCEALVVEGHTVLKGNLNLIGTFAMGGQSLPNWLSSAGFLNQAVFGNQQPANFTNATAATSSANGALTVAGGLGVAKDSYINGVRVGKGAGNVNYTTANTALGNEALQVNVSGGWNTATGNQALYSNTTGSSNASFGYQSLYYNNSGGSNVAVGSMAGKFQSNGGALTDPENSIYIGAGAKGHDNDDSNSIVIGSNAIGEGPNTTVIGNSGTTKTRLFGAVSLGGASSVGYISAAMSTGSANGDYSTAMSEGYASGDHATAMSRGYASGDNSTVMSGGYASGDHSTAMSYSNANGDCSTAMSIGNANGDCSTAMSFGNSNGVYSMASGFQTNAQSLSCAALGSYNISWGSVDLWMELDPIFLVGNGTVEDISIPSNAITTLKNGQTTLTNKAWNNRDTATVSATADPTTEDTDSGGNALVVDGHTVLNGKVTIAVPQGDISMGIYQ